MPKTIGWTIAPRKAARPETETEATETEAEPLGWGMPQWFLEAATQTPQAPQAPGFGTESYLGGQPSTLARERAQAIEALQERAIVPTTTQTPVPVETGKVYFEDVIPGLQEQGVTGADISSFILLTEQDPASGFVWRDPANREQWVTPGQPGAEGGEPPQVIEQNGYLWMWDEALGWQPLGQARQTPEQRAQEQQMITWGENPERYYIPLAQEATGELPATPGPVAALQGVEPGAPLQAKPMATPSLQFWESLLPEEKEQVYGTLEWMGVSPESWLQLYRQMIPGVADRIPLRWNR